MEPMLVVVKPPRFGLRLHVRERRELVHAVHPLDEAVVRRVHARGAMLDAFHAQQQLIGMELGSSAELAAVVE